MGRSKPIGVVAILAVSIFTLLAGHLLLRAYMPNPAVGGVGFMLIVLMLSYVLFMRNDVFGFVLIVYVLSHFSYADFQGGLWNLIVFGLLGIHLIVNFNKSELRRADGLMFVLLFVFLLWNVLGWILNNPLPIPSRALGAAVLLGYIFIFYTASNLIITKERFRLFLVITLLMLSYELIVAINQSYHVFAWNTPLVGGYSDIGTTIMAGVENTSGTFTNFELFSEYALLIFCLLIPMLSSSSSARDLGFGMVSVGYMIVICLLIPMLTSTRSAAILMVLTAAAYYLILPTKTFSAIDRFSRQILLIMAATLIIPAVGVYVGLGNLEEDFSSLSGTKFTVESVVSGKAINRAGLGDMALQRISEESWWVGYGFGVPRSNRWAWFGVDPLVREVGVADYHNLYMALPMLYGWLGSLAFIAVILLTVMRLAGVSLQYRRRKDFLLVLSVGLCMFWFNFIVDEFKISILRNPNYHMLFWIWLGLSNSVVKSIRQAGVVASAHSAAVMTNNNKNILSAKKKNVV